MDPLPAPAILPFDSVRHIKQHWLLHMSFATAIKFENSEAGAHNWLQRRGLFRNNFIPPFTGGEMMNEFELTQQKWLFRFSAFPVVSTPMMSSGRLWWPTSIRPTWRRWCSGSWRTCTSCPGASWTLWSSCPSNYQSLRLPEALNWIIEERIWKRQRLKWVNNFTFVFHFTSSPHSQNSWNIKSQL